MRCVALLSIVPFALVIGSPALADPPSNCAGKFVGTWEHYSNGVMTNRAIVKANGQAPCIETGRQCVKESTWTCDGDRFLYTTEYGSYTYIYNAAKGTLENGSNVAYRIGKGPNSAGPAMPAAAPAPPAPATAKTAALAPSDATTDLRQCVVEKTIPKAHGVNWYSLINNCRRRITVDIDDCDLSLSPNTVQCVTKMQPLAPRSEFGPTPNHRHPLNARNFR